MEGSCLRQDCYELTVTLSIGRSNSRGVITAIFTEVARTLTHLYNTSYSSYIELNFEIQDHIKSI